MNVPKIERRTVMEIIDDGEAVTSGRNRRMMWLLLSAVQSEGGKCMKSDVLAAIMNGATDATEEEIEFFHQESKTFGQLAYRGRHALISFGLLRRTGRSWAVTDLGSVVSDEHELHFLARDEPVAEMETERWQERIINRLKDLEPTAFEQFVGQLLSKAGVFDVKVTGQSGDGGIDGVGSTVNGPFSAPIFFQAKRYAGSVSSSQVRDFRGAVQGRGHQGMIITTGSFTKDAMEEAERTQAVNIKLVDGAKLAEWLKDLRMGVEVKQRMVEDVTVDVGWWDELEQDSEPE